NLSDVYMNTTAVVVGRLVKIGSLSYWGKSSLRTRKPQRSLSSSKPETITHLRRSSPALLEGFLMRALLLCLAFGIALPGCAVRELRDDQDKIRCALLDLYTNQIIDN